MERKQAKGWYVCLYVLIINNQEMKQLQYIRDFNTGIKIKAFITGFVLALSPVILTAQATIGARSFAMGQTGTALINDSWSLFHNPSLLRTDKPTVSFYGMRYAGFIEITDVAAVLTANGLPGTIGTGIHRYGFDLFSETLFSLGYKNSLQQLHYGILVNYRNITQGGGYGSASAISIDAGLAALIGHNLLLGTRLTNLNHATYGSTDEGLPRELSIGLSYTLNEQLLFSGDAVKDVRFPLSLRSGIEFIPVPGFYARTGISTEPVTWSLGFGYETNQIFLNIAVQRHEVLGMSPALDFGMHF